MKTYRKKPVEIKAIQWDGSNIGATEIIQWAAASGHEIYFNAAYMTLRIETLEGSMIAQKDDFVIQGVKGEFYPCKPDIFSLTYEPVEENNDQ